MRTAPTPSQPPTPYTETAKPLPGEQQEKEPVVQEAGDQGVKEVKERTDTPDADLAAEVATKCAVSETDSVKSLGASNPPDLVSHVPASASASSPEPKENNDLAGDKETDSLADLDIVAVGNGDGLESPPDNMTVPDNLEDEAGLESPPDMSASPEPGTVSPVISLPDAPSSEPGSPDLKVSQ